jgi:F1F0 ATPase subunit 2
MISRMINMGEATDLIEALLAGVLLGAVFYYGLWWTVRGSVAAKRVSLWLTGSFVLRTIIAVSGFYWVSQGDWLSPVNSHGHADWRRLTSCLLGFVIARIGVTRLTRSPRQPKVRHFQGSGP